VVRRCISLVRIHLARGPAIDPHGFDAGKKIKGKKRHILVDTQGLLMHAIVHAADVQDRDGGALLMASLFGAFPFLIKLYADGGYQGPEFQSAMKRILARVNVEIVKRSGQATGFIALPKRWIVERTFAGSAAADDWPRTGNASTTRRSPSSASPPSASCCENYAIPPTYASCARTRLRAGRSPKPTRRESLEMSRVCTMTKLILDAAGQT